MVEIIDNFLSVGEFSEAWERIKKVTWRKFSPGAINRMEINIPFLEGKLCGSDEDYFSYITRMDDKINPSMKWHTDVNSPLKLKKGQEWVGECAQWLIYMGGDFTGGNLLLKDRTIEPKTNRFVILDPFTEEHCVEPVKGFRYALNGFIYKYKEV